MVRGATQVIIWKGECPGKVIPTDEHPPGLLEHLGGLGAPCDGKKGQDLCVMHHPNATAPTGQVFPQMQHPT